MPYLTLIPVHALVGERLNSHRSPNALLNSPDFRHRAVMGIFPELGDRPRSEENILFRYEVSVGKVPAFLIQSDVAPQADKLPAEAQTKTFEFPAYQEGETLTFRISVNGIIRHSKGGISPVGFANVEAEEDSGIPPMEVWLAEKLKPAFSALEVVNHTREILVDRIKPSDNSEGKPRKTIQVDTVDGVATVGDPKALTELLHEGVGRSRSYGCGLLTVSRI